MTLPFISQLGVNEIAHSEGVKLRAYKCPAGRWTIGAGHTGAMCLPRVYEGMEITHEEAISILQDDLAATEQIIHSLVTVPLSQGQYDALVSFVFNVGEDHFRRSTLLRVLNKGRYSAVPAQLIRWTRSKGKVIPGLVTRRSTEAAMWNGAAYGHGVPLDSPIPQRVDPPKIDLKPTTGHVVSAGGGALTASLPEAIPQLLQHVNIHTLEHYAAGIAIAVCLFVAGILTDRFILNRKDPQSV